MVRSREFSVLGNGPGNTSFWLGGSFVGKLLWLLHTTTNKQTSNNLDRIQGKWASCLLIYHSHSLSAKINVKTAHPFSVTISTSLISPPPERRVFSKKFIMASLVVVPKHFSWGARASKLVAQVNCFASPTVLYACQSKRNNLFRKIN